MSSGMSGGIETSGPAGGGRSWGRFGEVASNALRYWEPRRVVYNLALFLVVVVECVMRWPASKSALTADTVLACFLLAVLANIAYCAAYAVDIFVQFAGLQSIWGKTRWIVFVVGTAFAATITHFFAPGVFEAAVGR